MSQNKSESETEYTNPKGVEKNNFDKEELQNKSYKRSVKMNSFCRKRISR